MENQLLLLTKKEVGLKEKKEMFLYQMIKKRLLDIMHKLVKH